MEERADALQSVLVGFCPLSLPLELLTYIYSVYMLSGPSVVFMLKHLKLSGCNVTPDNIVCSPCDMSRSGGFSPQAGAIVMCQSHFFSKRHMEDTLVHELVHMYDHCKFKVDWNNLRHHACSEVCLFIQISRYQKIDYLRREDTREQPKWRLQIHA